MSFYLYAQVTHKSIKFEHSLDSVWWCHILPIAVSFKFEQVKLVIKFESDWLNIYTYW